jgi:hypothetical protein
MPPRQSPWGITQGKPHELAIGVVSVTTAGHGGIWLEPGKAALMEALFAPSGFRPFAGSWSWYEEDCDWAAVAVAFPYAFGDEHLYAAVQTIRGKGLGVNKLLPWLEQSMCVASKVRERAAAFETSHANLWQRGSMGSAGKGWRVWFTRLHDKALRIVDMADYPEQAWYTSEELDALNVAEM